MKKTIVLVLAALFLAGALAQEGATTPTLEIRLSIVENRLGRLEADVIRLSTVPEAVARIEEKLTALTERASGNSNVLQTVGLGVVMSVLTGWVSYSMGKKSK
ncbi:MAG TPA: hypothetical protein VF164_11920 [Trueperaceae bacterium]